MSDVLPFGRLWYGDTNAVNNAIGYAEHWSRSHRAVIRVYDEAGNVIERRTSARAISKSGSAVKMFAIIGLVGPTNARTEEVASRGRAWPKAHA